MSESVGGCGCLSENNETLTRGGNFDSTVGALSAIENDVPGVSMEPLQLGGYDSVNQLSITENNPGSALGGDDSVEQIYGPVKRANNISGGAEPEPVEPVPAENVPQPEHDFAGILGQNIEPEQQEEQEQPTPDKKDGGGKGIGDQVMGGADFDQISSLYNSEMADSPYYQGGDDEYVPRKSFYEQYGMTGVVVASVGVVAVILALVFLIVAITSSDSESWAWISFGVSLVVALGVVGLAYKYGQAKMAPGPQLMRQNEVLSRS